MKKGKRTVIITIAIACFALTTIMFMQFKIVNQTDITSIETMREEELRTELANWKEKYKEAEEQYQEKYNKLEEYKQKEQSDAQASELVQKELEQSNLYLGNTNVVGEGIIITLKDLGDEEFQQITADDLLIIVDYLKNAGAEAISINGQRIVPTTGIICGGNIIEINREKVGVPFVIEAIGLPEQLAALERPYGYLDILKGYGIEVKVERSNDITIPKYSGTLTYNYASTIK